MSEQISHLKEVSSWLDQNVTSYPTPTIIALTNFEVDWGRMTGYFHLILDGLRIPDAFSLSLGQNGWMQFHPPMFQSPLGAPASYGAVNLTDQTTEAISKALQLIFPRLRPLGLDSESGELIIGRTPLQSRIYDALEFENSKSNISNPHFIFSRNIANK
jgi:hypothetical protein